MLKKQRRVIIGVALVAAVAAAYVLFGSRLSSLLPKAAATGDEVAVAPKTLVFGVDATGLLRATAVQNYGGPPMFAHYRQIPNVKPVAEGKTRKAGAVQNYGGPPMFADYWQFQIVNLVAEGKQVKAGEQLITFDAQKIRVDLQRFQNELDQANKELEKTRTQIDLERQELLSRLAA